MSQQEMRFFPSIELMEQWFVEFNEQFFEGELETIDFRVCKLKRKTHGCFSDPKEEDFHPEECYIALNAMIMDTEEEWRNTMLHEMVHYYVYKHFGKVKRPHGREFKEIAKRIKEVSNIDITTYVEGDSGQYRSNGRLPNLKTVTLKEPFILVFCEENPWIEEIEDEGKIYQIERSDYGYVFKTEEQYIPVIIENYRGMNVRLRWMRVTTCSIETRRIKISYYAPGIRDLSYDKDAVVLNTYYLIFEDNYGKTTWDELGTTLVSVNKVEGFVPPKNNQRTTNFEGDASKISMVATQMIKERYLRNRAMFRSVFKNDATNHFFQTSRAGYYKIVLDSRYKTLLTYLDNDVLINPMYSKKMMEAIAKEDWQSLEKEIKAVL